MVSMKYSHCHDSFSLKLLNICSLAQCLNVTRLNMTADFMP